MTKTESPPDHNGKAVRTFLEEGDRLHKAPREKWTRR